MAQGVRTEVQALLKLTHEQRACQGEILGHLENIINDTAQLPDVSIRIQAFARKLQKDNAETRRLIADIATDVRKLHGPVTVFSDPFVTLDKLYIRPEAVFQRVHIEEFSGREWLMAKVDEFLTTHKSGLFVLVGQAGVGKTSFLANLVHKRATCYRVWLYRNGVCSPLSGEMWRSVVVFVVLNSTLSDQNTCIRSCG
jgi:ATP-dependent Clp protease ATP-binding subunit ClpA